MSKTLIVCSLLISLYGLACAVPGGIAQASARWQSPAAPARAQGGDCDDVPSCRETIKRLQAELAEMKGGTDDPQKRARAAALARSLRKLNQLERRGGAGRRADSPAGDQPAPPPRPNTSPLTAEEFLNELKATLKQAEQPVDVQAERDGNFQIVKDLSVGVLKVEYDKDVKAGSAFPLKVTITPRKFIKESYLKKLTDVPLTFQLKPLYEPRRSSLAYNAAASNGPELREFDTDNPMVWVWDVTPREGFDSDKADLILNAQARIGNRGTDWQEVSRSEIEFKEGGIRSWIYANPDKIIAILTAALPLVGTIPAVMVLRRGRKVKQLNQKIKKQQVLLKQQQTLLAANDRELANLRYVHLKLQKGFDDFKRRWEHLDWLRQISR